MIVIPMSESSAAFLDVDAETILCTNAKRHPKRPVLGFTVAVRCSQLDKGVRASNSDGVGTDGSFTLTVWAVICVPHLMQAALSLVQWGLRVAQASHIRSAYLACCS